MLLGHQLAFLDSFVYLGRMITADNSDDYIMKAGELIAVFLLNQKIKV